MFFFYTGIVEDRQIDVVSVTQIYPKRQGFMGNKSAPATKSSFIPGNENFIGTFGSLCGTKGPFTALHRR